MDDYKRSLYMEARRLIADGESPCICNALFRALNNWQSINTEEVFSELHILFDGAVWYPSGHAYKHRDTFRGYWWGANWKEPRLRMIDCILNRDT